jgi:hypothetical protein
MPARAMSPIEPDEYMQLALQIDRHLRKGPGSTHARVRDLRNTLEELARTNFLAGQKAGPPPPEPPPEPRPLLCSICREPQFMSSSGVACKNGHTGAPSLEA